MVFLYDLGIFLYVLLVRLAALKSEKARAWIDGRREILDRIKASVDQRQKYAWFHFASLGEFEQGRPVLEELKKRRPQTRVIITFFSPSGFQIRKNYEFADHVFYLPKDTRANAREFIQLINPEFAVFTKYDFWYHYFQELKRANIPLYLIASLFRESQPFFKIYGGLHIRMLGAISHFFVQDRHSAELLTSIGHTRISVCGDTRFDRVLNNLRSASKIPLISNFCNGEKAFIAGSTWPRCEKLLTELIAEHPGWKFIIAPHEVNKTRISELSAQFTGSITLTELEASPDLALHTKILIIDRIGVLASSYQYGRMAYIGGGFGSGIHNTQEALAFGLPVIFGPNYKKFKEARDMVKLGAAISISSSEELKAAASYFDRHPEFSAIAANYIIENTGATKLIIDHILGALMEIDQD